MCICCHTKYKCCCAVGSYISFQKATIRCGKRFSYGGVHTWNWHKMLHKYTWTCEMAFNNVNKRMQWFIYANLKPHNRRRETILQISLDILVMMQLKFSEYIRICIFLTHATNGWYQVRTHKIYTIDKANEMSTMKENLHALFAFKYLQ